MEIMPTTVSAVDHRQVADLLLAHQRHAFARAGARRHVEHVARHDVADPRFLRVAALQRDLARVVALGEHADQLALVHDHQRADLVFGQQLQRLEHGVVGPRMPQRAFTALEQFGYGFHRGLRSGQAQSLHNCARRAPCPCLPIPGHRRAHRRRRMTTAHPGLPRGARFPAGAARPARRGRVPASAGRSCSTSTGRWTGSTCWRATTTPPRCGWSTRTAASSA